MNFFKAVFWRIAGRWLLALLGLVAAYREATCRLRGTFRCRIVEPDGTVSADFAVKNAATTVGLNYMLDGGFRAQSQITAWYVGLINGSGFSSVQAADTISSHAGWTEYTAYSETNRQTWSPGAASGGVIVNSTVMTFTNGGATGSIQGMFLASSQAKAAATGTLFSTAVEGSPRSLAAGATFQVYYELDLTPIS